MKSFRHRYTRRKDGEDFCPLPSPLVAPCIRTGLFWLFSCLLPAADPSSPHQGSLSQHAQGSHQRQAPHAAMPQTPGLLYNSTGVKQCSVSSTASADRRMVMWLLLRERCQMPFQQPYCRYAQKRWVYAFQRGNVRALCHSKRRVYGSYFWKMEYSDSQLPSRHVCKGTRFFPICFRRIFLHMGNFWIGHKPLSLNSWWKCKNAWWNFKSASKAYNVKLLEPLKKPKLLRSGYKESINTRERQRFLLELMWLQ